MIKSKLLIDLILFLYRKEIVARASETALFFLRRSASFVNSLADILGRLFGDKMRTEANGALSITSLLCLSWNEKSA